MAEPPADSFSPQARMRYLYHSEPHAKGGVGREKYLANSTATLGPNPGSPSSPDTPRLGEMRTIQPYCRRGEHCREGPDLHFKQHLQAGVFEKYTQVAAKLLNLSGP